MLKTGEPKEGQAVAEALTRAGCFCAGRRVERRGKTYVCKMCNASCVPADGVPEKPAHVPEPETPPTPPGGPAIRPEGVKGIVMRAARAMSGPFTVEDLTVAAWKLDREKLGLSGYRDLYPDHNRVASTVWGKKGLVGKGLLELSNGLLKIAAQPKDG